VADTVAGILAALESIAANDQIINIGSTHEISIVELAKLIHRLSGSTDPLRLEFVPYKKISGQDYEDVRRRIPDVSKAEKLLGFKAEVSLEDGLRRTLAWQKAARSAEHATPKNNTGAQPPSAASCLISQESPHKGNDSAHGNAEQAGVAR
jgi:UDP-glucose 4-epimerase